VERGAPRLPRAAAATADPACWCNLTGCSQPHTMQPRPRRTTCRLSSRSAGRVFRRHLVLPALSPTYRGCDHAPRSRPATTPYGRPHLNDCEAHSARYGPAMGGDMSTPPTRRTAPRLQRCRTPDTDPHPESLHVTHGPAPARPATETRDQHWAYNATTNGPRRRGRRHRQRRHPRATELLRLRQPPSADPVPTSFRPGRGLHPRAPGHERSRSENRRRRRVFA
jgi:hypothetical protein